MTTGLAQEVDYQVVIPTTQKEGSRYVFYAGNVIAASDAARDPKFANGGGIVKPSVSTLRYCGGFIPRCVITEMRQEMQAVPVSNVHPEKRETWVSTFQAPRRTPDGRVEMTTIGLNSQGEWDGLLRKPIYPVDDLPYMLAEAEGIVEMPCRTQAERARAQNFLFPKFDGNFPPTIQALKQYFVSRLKIASDEFEVAVANAAIASCDQIIVKGREEIRKATAEHSRAEKKGWAWSTPGVALCYFEMLGVPSPERAEVASEDKLDQLTTNIDRLVGVMADREIRNGYVQPMATEPLPAPAPAEPAVKLSVGDRVRLDDGTEGEVTKNMGVRVEIRTGTGETVTVGRGRVTPVSEAEEAAE